MIFSGPCAEARRIRAELGAEQRQEFLIDTHRPVTEERVVFGRDVQIIHRLVAADIHGAHDDRLACGGFHCLTVNVVKLIFGRRSQAIHIQHFGTEQAYCLCTVAEGRLCFYRMGDIGGNFHPHTVGRAPRLIEIGTLLAADLLAQPLLLQIVTTNRFAEIASHQPKIAVDLHRLIQIWQHCSGINANQSWNVKGAC